MKRTTAWTFALITALLAVGLNALIEYFIGFNVSSFCLFIAVPVGTMLLAAIGLSGFLFGASRTRLTPNVIDLGFLMCLALGIAVGIYGYQYWLVTGALEPAHRPEFGAFVYDKITNTIVTLRSRYFPASTGKAEELGLVTAIITIGALPAIAKAVHSTAVSWSLYYDDANAVGAINR